MTDKLHTVITTFDNLNMSPYVAGPIYSSWLFRVNAKLINDTSRLVRFPDGDGIEHTPWEQDVSEDARSEIANWLGVRNSIVDAIDNLEGGYPPSEIADTYDYLVRNDPENNGIALKQGFAKEYLERKRQGDKLHSGLAQFVEDSFSALIKGHQTLIDNRDQVLGYLDKASYVKDRSNPVEYSNLPEWFEDMIHNTTQAKFADMYTKKLCLLDRKLSPVTRSAVETELFLMENAAETIGLDLPKAEQAADSDDSAYLQSIGLKVVNS
jgi:hypothetical protein